MLLADCNSNLAGGSKKWKDIYEQTMRQAPDEDLRYKISEVSKVFKANIVGYHARAMDAIIEQYLQEHPSELAVCSGQGPTSERPQKKARAAPAVEEQPSALAVCSGQGPALARPKRQARAAPAVSSGPRHVAAKPDRTEDPKESAEVEFVSNLPVAAEPSSGASASRPAAVVAVSSSRASASGPAGIRRYFGGRWRSGVADPVSSGHGASSSSSSSGGPRPASHPARSSTDTPSSAAARNPDPENHYKVLGVSPNSSAAEVRCAFLVRVLEAHPDKGGRAADFNAVKQAYHILSDLEKRAAYDGRPEVEAPAGGDTVHDKVKSIVATLMVSPPAIWASLIQSMSRDSLAAAAELWEEVCAAYSKTKVKDRRTSIVVHDNNKNNDDVEESTQQTGLYRKSNGEWTVKVGWDNFFVKAEPIRSLEKASRVLTAVIHGREMVKARRKAFFRSLASNRCPVASRGNDVDECPQLLHSELLAILCMEPFPLQFSSDLSRAKPRIMSPFTPSYDLSIEFRILIRKVQDKFKEGVLLREELDKNARASMRVRAEQDRADRVRGDLELLECLNKELSSRGSRREGDDAAGAAGGTVAQQGQEVPALQDTVAAAVASVAAELSAAHRSALDEFSATMRRENAELFEQCREAIQDREEKRLREEALQKDLTEAQTKQEELRRKVDEKQSELEETLKMQLAKIEEERARGQAAEPNTLHIDSNALQEQLAAMTIERDGVTKQRDELQNEIVKLQHQRANDRHEADLRVQMSRAPTGFSKQAASKFAAEQSQKQRQISNLQEAAKAAVSKVLPARERAYRLARGLTL